MDLERQSLKRPRNETTDEVTRPGKRPRIGAKAKPLIEPLELAGVSLLTEVVDKIFTCFSLKEVLAFEQLSQECRDHTAPRWKQWAIDDRLDFDWVSCKEEIYPAKYRYLLGSATLQYIEDREQALKENPPQQVNPPQLQEKLQNIYRRFEGLMVRFPIFGAFVWNDLSPRSPKLVSPYQQRFAVSNLEKPFETGGELLLQGLNLLRAATVIRDHIPKEELGKTIQVLVQAIQKNATCASFLAVRGFFDQRLLHFYQQLGTLSIGKNNDCRGLDEFFTKDQGRSVRIWFDNGTHFPPVLACFAKTLNSAEQREPLLETAIKGYGNYVPAAVWHFAARTKFDLNKMEEADELYSKAIVAFGDKTPPTLLENAALVKYKLEKWDEADKLFSKTIFTYGVKAPPRVWAYAASVKSKLGKWQKADELCSKSIVAFDAIGDKAPPEVLMDAAYVKSKLGKWQEADELYSKSIVAFDAIGDKAPPGVLMDAANVKTKLEQWDKADELYSQAIVAYGDKVPSQVLDSADYVKAKIKEMEQNPQL